jgi:hypothetical protein
MDFVDRLARAAITLSRLFTDITICQNKDRTAHMGCPIVTAWAENDVKVYDSCYHHFEEKRYFLFFRANGGIVSGHVPAR